MDKLFPWTVWGRYEDLATEKDPDHQVAHVDFATITYEYEETKRKFEVQEVNDNSAEGAVVIKAFENMPGAKVWESTFQYKPKAEGYHWVLSYSFNRGASLKTQLPMTQNSKTSWG